MGKPRTKNLNFASSDIRDLFFNTIYSAMIQNKEKLAEKGIYPIITKDPGQLACYHGSVLLYLDDEDKGAGIVLRDRGTSDIPLSITGTDENIQNAESALVKLAETLNPALAGPKLELKEKPEK